mgnify:CR=1 FL=1
MPLYDYHCQDCKEEFTELRRLAEMDALIACPCCGSRDTDRAVSGFSVGSGSSGATTGRSPFR